jgi:hypothetical protein
MTSYSRWIVVTDVELQCQARFQAEIDVHAMDLGMRVEKLVV